MRDDNRSECSNSNIQLRSFYMESSKLNKQQNTTKANGIYTRNINLQNPDMMQSNVYPLSVGISMISLNDGNNYNSEHKMKSLNHRMNGIKHDKNINIKRKSNYILHQKRRRKKQNNLKIKHFLSINDNNNDSKKRRRISSLSSILFGDMNNNNHNNNHFENSGKIYRQKHKNSKINLLKHQIKKKKIKDVSIFKLHESIHHCDLKSFECDICHQTYSHWNQLKEHIQTHSMPTLSI